MCKRNPIACIEDSNSLMVIGVCLLLSKCAYQDAVFSIISNKSMLSYAFMWMMDIYSRIGTVFPAGGPPGSSASKGSESEKLWRLLLLKERENKKWSKLAYLGKIKRQAGTFNPRGVQLPTMP